MEQNLPPMPREELNKELDRTPLSFLATTTEVIYPRPQLDESGPVRMLSWGPLQAEIRVGPIRFYPRPPLKIWADSRVRFEWAFGNVSDHARQRLTMVLLFGFNTSGHEPVRELGTTFLRSWAVGKGSHASGIELLYNQRFQDHFDMLGRADIDAVLRLTAERE